MSLRDEIIAQATRRRGIPYCMPPDPQGDASLDCSLFVVHTLRDAGVPMPPNVRTAEQLRQASVPVDWNDVQVGDLLFFEHTYEPGGPPGPDGRIASHVGISLGKGTQRMWDCHDTDAHPGRPGVGETVLNPEYWQPKLFEARRPPGIGDADQSSQQSQISSSQSGYRPTTTGVRLRSSPGTGSDATVVVPDLGHALLTVVDDQVVSADGYQWRHVRTPNGTVGWVAASYLAPADGGAPGTSSPGASTGGAAPSGARYRPTISGVRMRQRPGTGADVPVLVQNLGSSILTAVDDQLRSADGHQWRHVKTADDTTGWVADDLLRPADGVVIAGPDPSDGNLSDDGDHQFSFGELRPTIEAMATKYGTDPQVVAGIIMQESGFKNYLVHFDGHGRGLVGLDDRYMLLDCEQWCGEKFVQGGQVIKPIPPALQIEFCARTIANYSGSCGGNPYNAARAWHRGLGGWQDEAGANYERLLRAHIARLYS
jgi:SH3-like domain-containing protein